MTANYDYWQAAIDITDGKRPLARDEMKSLGLNEGEDVGLGFYKKRASRAGLFLPVAIFEK